MKKVYILKNYFLLLLFALLCGNIPLPAYADSLESPPSPPLPENTPATHEVPSRLRCSSAEQKPCRLLGEASSIKSFREEYPLQLQLILGGGGFYVSDFGLQLGYHITHSLYLGMTSLFPEERTIHTSTYDSLSYHPNEIFGQDGAKQTKFSIEERQMLEIRFMPWDSGFFVMAGALKTGVDEVNVKYDQRLRVVGENAYTTGLKNSVRYDPWIGSILGVGISHVFQMGLSVGCDLRFSLSNAQTPHVKVLAIDNETPVQESDLQFWKEQIEMNEQRSFGMFLFGVGYNF